MNANAEKVLKEDVLGQSISAKHTVVLGALNVRVIIYFGKEDKSMSCQHNDHIWENCYDTFCELMDTREFYEAAKQLSSHESEWNEKELGREDYNEWMRIFNLIWVYDAEAIYEDVESACLKYIRKMTGYEIE